MKKLVLGVVGVAVIMAAVVVRSLDAPATDTLRPWKTTDVWYRSSDVATLARTGRPQLVEFFHPD